MGYNLKYTVGTSFFVNHKDAQDKDYWRLGINGATG